MGAVRLLSLCAAVLYLVVLVLGIIACSTTHWLHWFQPRSGPLPLAGLPAAATYGLQAPQLQYLLDALNYAAANGKDLTTLRYQEVAANHIGLWRLCQDSAVQLSLADGSDPRGVFPSSVLDANDARSAPETHGCRGYRSGNDTAMCSNRVRDGVRTTRAFVIMGIIFSGLALLVTLGFAALHQKTALFAATLCLAFFTFACWIIAISVWPGAMNGGFCPGNFSYRGLPVMYGRANRMQYDYSYWIAIVCPILAFINLLLLVVVCALPKDQERDHEEVPPQPLQVPSVLPAEPHKQVDLQGIHLNELVYYPPVVQQPQLAVLPQPMPYAGPPVAMGPPMLQPMQYMEAPPVQLLVPGQGYVMA